MTNPTACRDLKPCPFCGSPRPDIVTMYPPSKELTIVFAYECNKCGCKTPWCPKDEDARLIWNTRAPEGEAVADVTPLSDVTLLRNLCEDMDMPPTLREQLRSLAKRIEQGAQTVVTHCRRCGEHAEVTIHISQPRATSADVVIETCESSHRFAILPDHPRKNGLARCPHCLAKGLDQARATSDEVERDAARYRWLKAWGCDPEGDERDLTYLALDDYVDAMKAKWGDVA